MRLPFDSIPSIFALSQLRVWDFQYFDRHGCGLGMSSDQIAASFPTIATGSPTLAGRTRVSGPYPGTVSRARRRSPG